MMPRDNEEGRKKDLLEVTATSSVTFSETLLPQELGVHHWMIGGMDAIIFEVFFTLDILGFWVKERLSAVWGGGGATLGAHGDITAEAALPVFPSPLPLLAIGHLSTSSFLAFSPWMWPGVEGTYVGPQKPAANLNPARPLLPGGVQI